ncbi:MAG TPA: aminotransferase class I/II-fold pyridoxal phosphate-dependent enzyme [Solirubrobacteraceae bacterium]|jgi:N-succinyldiaminopimelate aminotransferase|nr:aminotransferase class I/II-fold pyridoxal phosphate-dependent enzyme [Solirubrobacteraceae bacterium]
MTALAEATGAINLGQGFPDFDGPPAIIEAAVEALRAGANQYAPLAGVPVLRRAIADHQLRHYGLDLDPETEIQVTFGATEALAAAVVGLVGRGEEVAFLDPTYDSYPAIVGLAGGRARPIVLEPPGWRLDAGAVAAGIGRQTRVVIVNSPHNPTGRVLDADELELVAAACREHDVIAVTDEVYEHLVFDGTHVPLATLPGMRERTLTISSIGKTHSVTGWKVGWASGPAELIGRLRAVKQFTTFAGGTPLQHAAAVGLGLPESVGDDLRRMLRGKRDRLSGGLRVAGFEVLPTAATYFVTADASGLGEPDATAVCERLPHEAGVVTIPISAFAADAGGSTRSLIRFAFAKGDAVLDEAADRLCRWARTRT